MVGFFKMGCRVLVFRVIAAADMATGQAETEVDPGISDRETLFTAFRRFRFYILFYLIEMGTCSWH